MFRYAAHRRVIISLKSGLAVSGVIIKHRRGFCVVRDAEVIESGGASASADGEVLVQSADIDYIQIPVGK